MRARATARFPPQSTTPSLARTFVRETLCTWGAGESSDDALLLTTELVTNAVVHAGTSVDVVIEAIDGALIISVGDGYSARLLPAVIAQPHEVSESGRGLLLVHSLATRWGIEHSATGKRVWFEVPVGELVIGMSIEAPPATPHPHARPAGPARLPSVTPSGVSGMLGLADSVTARLGLDDLLDQVLRRLCTALGGDAAYVLLADDVGTLELRAAYGLDVDERAVLRARSGEGLAGRLGPDDLPVVFDDASGEMSDPLLTTQGMRSAVAAPLVVEGRMTGSLHVAARRGQAFDADDGTRLAQVTDRVALAIESARLSEVERRRRGWLSYVAEASDLLAGTLDLDRTLALVAQLVVPALGDWCGVHLLDDGGQSRLAYVWHADEALGDDIRKTLTGLPAPERRSSAKLTPPSRRQAWRPAVVTSLAAFDLVVYPLVARNEVLGSLMVGRSATERFRADEIDLTADLARRAALAVDNSRLFQERVAVATALQRSLLPPEEPVITGCEIGVSYVSAGEGNDVGGDFYDVFPIGSSRWGVAIGDVCGKGAEAAAVTGLARHTIRLLGREGRAVTEVLERLNRAILEEGPRARFVTVAYAVIEPTDTGATIELCSAGHPLPMLLSDDGSVRNLGVPQCLLGVLPDPELASQRVTLRSGDTLLLFTDGVTERREGARMLGEDGLAEILRGCADLPATAIAARIERAVVDFQPEPSRDDMAVVVIRVL